MGESLKEVPCQLLKEGHISLLDRCEAGGSVFGSTKWLLREWKASTGCVGVRRTVLTQLKKKKKNNGIATVSHKKPPRMIKMARWLTGWQRLSRTEEGLKLWE